MSISNSDFHSLGGIIHNAVDRMSDGPSSGQVEKIRYLMGEIRDDLSDFKDGWLKDAQGVGVGQHQSCHVAVHLGKAVAQDIGPRKVGRQARIFVREAPIKPHALLVYRCFQLL